MAAIVVVAGVATERVEPRLSLGVALALVGGLRFCLLLVRLLVPGILQRALCTAKQANCLRDKFVSGKQHFDVIRVTTVTRIDLAPHWSNLSMFDVIP